MPSQRASIASTNVAQCTARNAAAASSVNSSHPRFAKQSNAKGWVFDLTSVNKDGRRVGCFDLKGPKSSRYVFVV